MKWEGLAQKPTHQLSLLRWPLRAEQAALRMGGGLGVLEAQQGSTHSDMSEDAEVPLSSCWAPSAAHITHPQPHRLTCIVQLHQHQALLCEGLKGSGNREKVGTIKNYRILNIKIHTSWVHYHEIQVV